MTNIRFIQFAIKSKALSFGEFKTKAGRTSPYFFNSGEFNDGKAIKKLAEFYVDAYEKSRVYCEVVFGSAYKGIPLAVAFSTSLSLYGEIMPYCFNRKEEKDHGEGGSVIGCSLKNKKVLIIDDVISSGMSIKESIKIIRDNGGIPSLILVALDRQEKGATELSSIQEIEKETGIKVVSVAKFSDIQKCVENNKEYDTFKESIISYSEKYGVK